MTSVFLLHQPFDHKTKNSIKHIINVNSIALDKTLANI